ncbi:MAG: hypothetical protein QM726_07250 [Chitinophagaceae bacterium]
MRKLCAFVFLVVTLQYCISCQKQLNYDLSGPSQGDSLVLVKTIYGEMYDSSDAFLQSERQTFTYDSILNRTVVEIADSSTYSPGVVEKYTVTFQYDAANRLSKFTTTGGYEPVAQMDFNYGSSGDLVKLTMQNNWVSKTFDIQFSTSIQNGQKTITVYDTNSIRNSYTGGDTRPEISNYKFDENNRLITETIAYTYYTPRKNWYQDTFELKYNYDNNNFISGRRYKDSYYNAENNGFLVVNIDSLIYTAEGSNAALMNSFLYVYKNMFWLNISEYSTGFSNAINKGDFQDNSSAAIKTGEHWSFVPPDPVAQNHYSGFYNNSFDANGLLIKSVYPKNFGNKYGGKNVVYYTYTKIKK